CAAAGGRRFESHDQLSAPPALRLALSARNLCGDRLFSLLVAIASEPIRAAQAWVGPEKFKRLRPFRPGRVLGRSWQTCAEAGSHPVKNSVISNSCEGFAGANRSASTVARDDGPNVARFLVNLMGSIDGVDHNRHGRRSD